jgi:hypothetical protein
MAHVLILSLLLTADISPVRRQSLVLSAHDASIQMTGNRGYNAGRPTLVHSRRVQEALLLPADIDSRATPR